jgi:hypothetical protein
VIPLVRSIVYALLWDAAAVRRWLRGASIAFAVGGVAFADQLAGVIGAPGAVKTIKVVAALCAFIGGAISVGEKNAPPSPPAAP